MPSSAFTPERIPTVHIQLVSTPSRQRPFEDTLEHMAAAIDILPAQERLVLTLHYYEQLMTDEIAAVLEIGEEQVSRLHADALARLDLHLATD